MEITDPTEIVISCQYSSQLMYSIRRTCVCVCVLIIKIVVSQLAGWFARMLKHEICRM